jgi:uncharacterized protein with PQ loop repeat
VASILGIVAATWGVVMALAPLMQIRRMIARRSSADLSLGYFGILLPGFGLWLAYGLARDDWPVAIPNIVALTVGAATLVTGVILRRSHSAVRPRPQSVPTSEA